MKKTYSKSSRQGLPGGPNEMFEKVKGIIVSERGQWDFPGMNTLVLTDDGRITMRGVPYPVYGQDETGYGQMMYPGQEYQFPGNNVLELPMAQKGGGLPQFQGVAKSQVPTYSDSLELYQNTVALENFLRSKNAYLPNYRFTQWKWKESHPRVGGSRVSNWYDLNSRLSNRDQALDYLNKLYDEDISDSQKSLPRNHYIKRKNNLIGSRDWAVGGYDDKNLPVSYIHPQIKPQFEGDTSIPGEGMFYMYRYDPVAIKPGALLTPKELALRLKKYGKRGIPQSKIDEYYASKNPVTPIVTPPADIIDINKSNQQTPRKEFVRNISQSPVQLGPNQYEDRVRLITPLHEYMMNLDQYSKLLPTDSIPQQGNFLYRLNRQQLGGALPRFQNTGQFNPQLARPNPLTGKYAWEQSIPKKTAVNVAPKMQPAARATTNVQKQNLNLDRDNRLLDANLIYSDAPSNPLSNAVHTGLDAVGMVPLIGEPADLANALLYNYEGDLENAALSTAGVIPFLGMLGTGKRLLGKAKKAFSQGYDPDVLGPVGPNPKLLVQSPPEIKPVFKGVTHYGKDPALEAAKGALDVMKQQGRYLDNIGFDASKLSHEQVKFHGIKHGRAVVEVALPNGNTQLFYKSSGLAGKSGVGVGNTTQDLWQPYGGHASWYKSPNWFIKDEGYKDWYGSKSFRDISGNLDRIAAEGNYDLSGQLKAFEKLGGSLPRAQMLGEFNSQLFQPNPITGLYNWEKPRVKPKLSDFEPKQKAAPRSSTSVATKSDPVKAARQINAAAAEEYERNRQGVIRATNRPVSVFRPGAGDPEAVMEFMGVPGAVRFVKSPVQSLKGAGNTIVDLGLTVSPFANMNPAVGFQYAKQGTNPLTGEGSFRPQDVEGAFNTLDAAGLATIVGAGLKAPLQQGLKQTGNIAKIGLREGVDLFHPVGRNLKRIEQEGISKGLSAQAIKNRQMQEVGITSLQRKGYFPGVSEILSEYFVPYAYDNPTKRLLDIPKKIIKGDRNTKRLADLTKVILDEGKNTLSKPRYDAWRMYSGLPQKHGTFRIAETHPINHPSYTKNQLNNLEKFSLNDERKLLHQLPNEYDTFRFMYNDEDLIEAVPHLKEALKNINKLEKTGIDFPQSDFTTTNIMGGYNRRFFDNKMEYNDIWDLDLNGLKVDKYFGKPFMSHGQLEYSFEPARNAINTLLRRADILEKNINPFTKYNFDDINIKGYNNITYKDFVKSKKQLGGALPKAQKGDAYNMQRALELGYTPDEAGHYPSVDEETGMWLKSKQHPTAWMESMYGYQLNPEVYNNYNVTYNPEGYFGENQLQYVPKKFGGSLPTAGDPVLNFIQSQSPRFSKSKK